MRRTSLEPFLTGEFSQKKKIHSYIYSLKQPGEIVPGFANFAIHNQVGLFRATNPFLELSTDFAAVHLLVFWSSSQRSK